MKVKLDFYQTLEFQSLDRFPLWKMAEKFLNFEQKSYKVTAIQDKNIYLENSLRNPKLLLTILKATLCFTIALPFTLTAFLVRTVYRKQYSFEVLEKPLTPDPKTNERLSNLTQQAYKIDDVIATIMQAKKEGRKLGVFLGRENTQSLPREEGWEWFSLNIQLNEGPKDHHLKIDFNDSETMSKIKDLFNKVVVDYSTVKFFHKSPWPTLHQLLKKEAESEVIVEAYNGSCMIINESEPVYLPELLTFNKPAQSLSRQYHEERAIFQAWKKRIGSAEVENRRQEFLKQNPHLTAKDEQEVFFIKDVLKKENIVTNEQKKYFEELHKRTKDLLQNKYFNFAELRSDFFPYREGNEAIKKDFWVIRSPKIIH